PAPTPSHRWPYLAIAVLFEPTAHANLASVSLLAGRWRLIDHRPERTELFHGFHELLKSHRFHHVRVHPELVTPQQIALFTRGGHDHEGNRLEFRVVLHLAKHLETVH